VTYVFRAEGIGKRFGDRQVLTAASFWAEAGKIVTLMGRNGSGKTTLMRIAAGTLRGDHGVVIFGDYASERPSTAVMARRGLFFVPQDQVLAHGFTVGDHLRAVEASFRTDGTREVVERLGIGHILDQTRADISGGERMRASLALAILRRPTCLLIDEPLARVAPKDQEMLAGALRDLASRGTAIVTTGHDVRQLLELSDAIIWCVAGTTHHLGDPRNAADHEQFVREYLGPRGAGW
jgi:ABC-type multidrug transport system ATPase subunit